MTKVLTDLTIEVDSEINIDQEIPITSDFLVEGPPLVEKTFLTLDKPSIDDQKDDVGRLKNSFDNKINLPFNLIEKISKLLRENDFEITVISDDNDIYNIEAGDTSDRQYGIAVDIGTTTAVVYLIDLINRTQIDVISQMNLQKSYGADVISRISYVAKQEDGLKILNKTIISQIQEMILTIAEKSNIKLKDIIGVVMVGNTTMQHITVNLSPINIGVSPFIPVITDKIVCKTADIGLKQNHNAVTYFLPCISGYVGSDIVAAILASRMHMNDSISLLVDIGTNGEIALGSKEAIVSCSAAAGPAFEGAQIRHGVGGVPGAINSVKIVNGELIYTTIADKKPVGICGSGIVDITAMLIDVGIIDETGRILYEDEVSKELGIKLYERIIEQDGELSFIIAGAKETQNGSPIIITGKDIREIQLAKAAIAAGINILIKKRGIALSDIQTVYLAGGFGSFIDKLSAVKIGLLPSELIGKIRVLGNAAGTGAIMALLSREKYKECDIIKNKVEYIELSGSAEFTEEYTNAIYF